MLTDSVGQELGKGTVGTVFLCPTCLGTQSERPAWLEGAIAGARGCFQGGFFTHMFGAWAELT